MKNWLFIIFIFSCVGGLLYWRPFSSHQKAHSEQIEGGAEESPVANPETIPVAEKADSPPAIPAPSSDSSSGDANLTLYPQAEAAIKEKFIEALKGMGSCLDIKTTIDTDRSDPTFENVVDSVRNEIGETVVRSEDWSVSEFTLPSGEQRRIRIEMDYEDDDRIVKRLRYFSVGKDRLPVIIPLTKEQSTDPTETFIASLESEGKVSRKEKGERAYFQNGEELILVDRNGRITEMEMNRNGKSFKCSALETTKSSCTCQ